MRERPQTHCPPSPSAPIRSTSCGQLNTAGKKSPGGKEWVSVVVHPDETVEQARGGKGRIEHVGRTRGMHVQRTELSDGLTARSRRRHSIHEIAPRALATGPVIAPAQRSVFSSVRARVIATRHRYFKCPTGVLEICSVVTSRPHVVRPQMSCLRPPSL